MTAGWRVGRIGGVDIRIDPSWPLVALLLTYSLWLAYANPTRDPSLGWASALGLAIVTAVLFFGSVLAHELAHAAVSRARGFPVAGITLFFFGGATHARAEARGPRDEALVAAAGPVASAALGASLLLAGVLAAGAAPLPGSLLRWLGAVNLTLAAFNLLPGFPLDGGRLLRAAVWRSTGSLERATRAAGRVGQGMGLLLLVGGLALAAQTGRFVLLWSAFIGWFLFHAATEAVVDADRRRAMAGVTVGEVMSPPPPSIPAAVPIGDARTRFLSEDERAEFPVVDGGRVLGWITGEAAREADPSLPTGEVALPAVGTIDAGPTERLDRVNDRLEKAGGRTILVIDDGRLVGIVDREELGPVLTRRSVVSARGPRPAP